MMGDVDGVEGMRDGKRLIYRGWSLSLSAHPSRYWTPSCHSHSLATANDRMFPASGSGFGSFGADRKSAVGKCRRSI